MIQEEEAGKLQAEDSESNDSEFEEYQKTRQNEEFKSWLLSPRLPSQELNNVITPIVYRDVDLSKFSFMSRLANVSAPPSEKVKVWNPRSCLCLDVSVMQSV
jgi:hypothetical protein